MDRLIFDDERLMALAAGGDEKAFQALVRRLGSMILTLATRLLGDECAADDVFTEVVTKMWMRRETYDVKRAVVPWVRAITVNSCREVGRKTPNARYTDVHDAGVVDERELLRGTDAAGERESARVDSALQRLPERQREVLVLRIWGGLAYAHIAASISLPEATVRSHMHHALASMRGMLGESEPGKDSRQRLKEGAAEQKRSAE